MRKNILTLSLFMIVPMLFGCGEEKEIPEIIFEGNLTKTQYNFNDSSWDLSGIKIMGKYKDGSTKELSKEEYTLELYPGLPRGYKGMGLKLSATYKGASAGKSKTYSNITVANEVYNSEAEISSYYSDFNFGSHTKNIFLIDLQNHSFQKHKKWVKYGEVQSYYGVTDEHRSVDEIPGKYKSEGFYTGKELTLGTGSKEHVWACNDTNGLWSHSGSNYVDDPNYVGGGADLLHVRPCSSNVNTARGDATFTEFNGGSEVGDGGPYTLKCDDYRLNGSKIEYSGIVEPDDHFKGDFARIVAYVYMHYKNFGSNHRYCGNLNLSQIINPVSYGSVSSLLKAWNEIDPVSEVERYRNHTVMGIQGNRNPFVDHPEWIDIAF